MKLFFSLAVAYVALWKRVDGGHCADATAAGTAVRRRRGARNGADGQTRDARDVRDILCIVAVCSGFNACDAPAYGRRSHVLKSSDGALRPGAHDLRDWPLLRKQTPVLSTKTPHCAHNTADPIDAYTTQSTRLPLCRVPCLSSAFRRSWCSPSTTAPASSPSTTRTHTRQPATRMTTPVRSHTRR
jgi:hypothetical protein